MAKLEELNKNIMSVLLKLVSSQNLCKYLTYDSNDPLSENDIDDPSKLIFTKIFPIPKILGVLDKEVSIITMIFDEIKLSNNTGFKDTMLCMELYVHIDKWRMGGDLLRIYAIMNEIDKLLNNQRVVGLGKMQFYKARFVAANNKFMGYKIDYLVVDFN